MKREEPITERVTKRILAKRGLDPYRLIRKPLTPDELRMRALGYPLVLERKRQYEKKRVCEIMRGEVGLRGMC